MFARVTYVQAPEGTIDQGLTLWRENVLPVTMARDGFAGVLSMVDRETGKALSITLWNLADDLFASTEAEYHRQAVAKYGEYFSGAHTPENYEVHLAQGPVFDAQQDAHREQRPTPPTDGETVLRSMFERGYNQRDEQAFDELISPEYVHLETSGPQGEGPENLKETVRWLVRGFPDFRMDVLDVCVEGDRVWTHTAFCGTHEGEFMGIAPTNQRVEARQVHMWRVDDGKVIEHRAVRDDLSLLLQIGGVTPTFEPAIER